MHTFTHEIFTELAHWANSVYTWQYPWTFFFNDIFLFSVSRDSNCSVLTLKKSPIQKILKSIYK